MANPYGPGGPLYDQRQLEGETYEQWTARTGGAAAHAGILQSQTWSTTQTGFVGAPGASPNPTGTAPRPVGTPGPSVPTPMQSPSNSGPLSAAQQDGWAYLDAYLKNYNLGALSPWAKEQIIAGNSPAMVQQLLWERPEFQQRFQVIFDRQKAGLPPMSVDEVLSFEKNATALFAKYDLPTGFYDSFEDFVSYQVNDISLQEMDERLQLRQQAVFQSPPEVRAALKALYGVNAGDLTAYWIDPNRAIPILRNQMQSASLSAAGARTGYGALTRDESERLTALGVSVDQAVSGLGKLVTAKELFTALPGEQMGQNITRAEQLRAGLEGDMAAQLMIEDQGRRRVAQFGGGGGFVGGRSGFAVGAARQ